MIESNGEAKTLKNGDLNIVASDNELDKEGENINPDEKKQVVWSNLISFFNFLKIFLLILKFAFKFWWI